jgi:HEAT repeat protein
MGEGGGVDGGTRAAREAATALAAAVSTAGLYPAGHAVRKETVQRLAARLSAFFERHEILRLDVSAGRLRWADADIQADPDPAGLPAILFRDGIRWIAFRKGVSERELKALAELLGRFRSLAPENEGDIATGLWEARFSHVLYDAEDPLAASEPVDLSGLNRGAAGGCWGDAEPDPDAPGLSPADAALWRLTPEEVDRVSRMVSEEENWEGTEDVLDVLVVILEEQADPEDFDALLAFIAEEFQQVLEAGDFGLAVNLLRNLRRLRETFQTDSTGQTGPTSPTGRSWAVPRLDDAFRELSGTRFLSLFAEVDLDLLGEAALAQVRRLLSLLPPEALGSLVPLLPAARSRHAREVLMTAAVRLAREDARPLNPFLEGAPPPELARYLVAIAGYLTGGAATRILFRMARHPEAPVRRHALRTLLAAGRDRHELILPLLDDPDTAVREMIHEQLGRRRDPDAERLLLAWAADGAGAAGNRPGGQTGGWKERRPEERREESPEEKWIRAYRTLGRCGSKASVAALKRGLMGRPLQVSAGRRRVREAAARALSQLDIPEAEAVLARAARSPFPAVRRAAWHVLEDRS